MAMMRTLLPAAEGPIMGGCIFLYVSVAVFYAVKSYFTLVNASEGVANMYIYISLSIYIDGYIDHVRVRGHVTSCCGAQ